MCFNQWYSVGCFWTWNWAMCSLCLNNMKMTIMCLNYILKGADWSLRSTVGDFSGNLSLDEHMSELGNKYFICHQRLTFDKDPSKT